MMCFVLIAVRIVVCASGERKNTAITNVCQGAPFLFFQHAVLCIVLLKEKKMKKKNNLQLAPGSVKHSSTVDFTKISLSKKSLLRLDLESSVFLIQITVRAVVNL